MRLYRASRSEGLRGDLWSLAAGSLLGLGIGILLSRTRSDREWGGDLRERMKGAARRLRPARRARLAAEQEELDRLEDRVLDEFLSDDILSERAIDISAITAGIIELTGEVRDEDEAQRAVNVVRRVPGVSTVVNRLEIEGRGGGGGRRRLDIEDVGATFGRQEGRVGGMGRRRQGLDTDPDRPDDSQSLREDALAAADRDQWLDEGYATVSGRTGEDMDAHGATPTEFDEDELDNQDPHGKRAGRTLDEQPRDLDSEARVLDRQKPVEPQDLD